MTRGRLMERSTARCSMNRNIGIGRCCINRTSISRGNRISSVRLAHRRRDETPTTVEVDGRRRGAKAVPEKEHHVVSVLLSMPEIPPISTLMTVSDLPSSACAIASFSASLNTWPPS